MSKLYDIIDKLEETQNLEKEEFINLLDNLTETLAQYAYEKARKVAREHFGNRIYIRGLIEISNYCKNDCLYCGIRRSNTNADRYRLNKEDVFSCCHTGYNLGFRTFVLQGGEDPFYSDEFLIELISEIKKNYPDCAITLSLGEKSRDSYQKLFDAGADRYLLRHETADEAHYSKLHPKELTLESRKSCLQSLHDIGYQTGTGFMVGSPWQTNENLAQDILFIKELSPEMVGLGPFIPHHDTPFAGEAQGALDKTLFLLALLRLMKPSLLLPSTTALGTIHPKGRELGILAGANVVMPNLSPVDVRKKYLLYDNKLSSDAEAAEGLNSLKKQMDAIGYEVVTDRGDYAPQLRKGVLLDV